MIKGIDHYQKIEMILLNVFLKMDLNTVTSVEIYSGINFNRSVSYELLHLFYLDTEVFQLKAIIILCIYVHLVHTFFKSGNILFSPICLTFR